MVITLKTAKALGLEVPLAILAIADEVIDQLQFVSLHMSVHGPESVVGTDAVAVNAALGLPRSLIQIKRDFPLPP